MEKVIILYNQNNSRFIVLTNKNIFAFTSSEKNADCTMNLILQTCGKVRICDEDVKKDYCFVKIKYFII
jgi:hypothetical protein